MCKLLGQEREVLTQPLLAKEDCEWFLTAVSYLQDKFATFTLEQVNQYMKNDKLRSKHQKALLDLRQQAVKEKTDAKLQWIDIKKRYVFLGNLNCLMILLGG